MTTILKTSEDGSGSISVSVPVPISWNRKLVSVTLALDGDPTTSEDFTITVNANAGAEYDVLLLSTDLSSAPTTNLVWIPPQPIILSGGDSIDVAYANTEANGYGLQVTMESA